jgi:eukaryotic-like serine/threonine-protein kinase
VGSESPPIGYDADSMRLGRFGRRAAPDAAARTTVVDEGAAPADVVEEGAPFGPAVEEEEYIPPRRPRPPELWPWLLLLLLLVVGGLLAAYFLTRDNGDKKKTKTTAAVTVPAVVGLKQSDAVARLNARGLVPRITTKPSRSPAGVVFAQQPGGGTQVARRSPVTISVSGAQVTSVPNVVGVPTTVAVKRLKANGLGASTTSVASSKPAGTVLAQSPAAKASVSKGSTVALKISKGRTTVPDVVGQQVATARAALRGAGLVAAVFNVPSAQPKGTVVAQHPPANTKAARGSKVRINVSSGSSSPAPAATTGTTTTTPASSTVRVPNVVGLQQSAAQRRLNRAGLGSRVVYVASPKPADQVIDQGPAAGTQVRRGSRVRIDISLGPNPGPTTTVPDVVGQDPQTATATLQDAGFSVQTINVPVTDPSQAGTVVDEQPGGGTKAPQGSQVTIYVGEAS